MATTTNLLSLLSPEDRDRLLQFASDVSFPAGARVFEEGSKADRFWIVITGLVALDVRPPAAGPPPSAPSARVNCSAGRGWSHRTPGSSAQKHMARYMHWNSTRRRCAH